jgi:hypothetical protein
MLSSVIDSPARQHEAIPPRPERLLRIVGEKLVPDRVSHRGEGHGRAGVAGIGLLNGVHRQGADGVDGKQIEAGSVVGHGEIAVNQAGRSGQNASPLVYRDAEEA